MSILCIAYIYIILMCSGHLTGSERFWTLFYLNNKSNLTRLGQAHKERRVEECFFK
jgi:hypothetical protein